MGIFDRIKGAWNAFNVAEQQGYVAEPTGSSGVSSNNRPDRLRTRYSSERTIVSSIYTRIGIDVASVGIRHVKLDEAGRYLDDDDSELNRCLTIQPNIDQGPRAFRQDIFATLFDKGSVAIVPVDTTVDPVTNEVFDIHTLRAGYIVAWKPKHVLVSLWNENKGLRQEVLLEKRFVAIVENPLFAVMNEQNSTLQRLIRKLNLLDAVDEQSGSGKLDLIIQLPYVIKSEARRNQAEQRRSDIEFQLKDSKYGIAYTDGTEKITQLNRPVENNLLGQIEFLTELLYDQLGITKEVMSGTATEATMVNYFNRTIEPILEAVVEAMNRSFIKVQGPRNEKIMFFRDPFKLMPISAIAEVADKFSRNEILSPNEIRGFIGIAPSTDPKADQLVNSNMPQPELTPVIDTTGQDLAQTAVDDTALSGFDDIDSTIDAIMKDLGVSTSDP